MNPLPHIPLLLLAATIAAQDPPAPVPHVHGQRFDQVLHDAADGTTPWAAGADWKASFGPAGFTFVPFFGATAPRNFPVHFAIESVHVGGRPLPFAREVLATRDGDRFEYPRGAVRERYDLSLPHVEQTILVDAQRPGDVEVVLTVVSQLTEDASQPGVQFRNEFGQVDYGAAFLVRDGERLPLTTTWARDRLTLHVPAALRGAGPVVIDPMVNTHTSTIGLPHPAEAPDIGWDETNQIWLGVFQYAYSSTDIDMTTQMFDSSGAPLGGSQRAVDLTSASAVNGRIANQRQSQRFAVVCEVSDATVAGGRPQVYVAVRDANPAGAITGRVILSDPAGANQATLPDVGGDPGSSNGSNFAVVWLGDPGQIWMRRVTPAGTALGASPQQIISHSSTFHNLRLSKSNGRGRIANPTWLMTCSQFVQGHHEIMLMPIDPQSGPGQPFTATTGVTDSRYPSVSDPVLTPTNDAVFVVSYERQVPAQARAIVYRPSTQTVLSDRDLTPIGVGPFWVRVQTDGVRFACTSSPDGSTINLATLAHDFATNQWTSQDGPYPLPGSPYAPQIASAASSGGLAADFAAVYIDTNQFGGRMNVTLYRAHAPGQVFAFASTGCNGLSITWTSYPLLGTTIGFPVTGHGADLPGVAFGAANQNPFPLCGSCQLGLRLDVPMQFFLTSQLDVVIPPRPSLVGAEFAVQSFALGSGPCLGGLTLGDTLWVTVK